MAGSASPEKIKELLSSFLAQSNKHTDKNKLGSANTSDSPLEDAGLSKPGSVLVPASNSSSNNLRSFLKFQERVDSFSAVTWFAKPADLNPLICARYGWENVDSDMLQCACCKAFLCGQLPNETSSDTYQSSLSNLKENLQAGHHKFCALAANPCPEHYCHVPVDDPVSLLSGFSDRVRSLSQIQDKLPYVNDSQLQSLGYDTSQGGYYCRRNLAPDSEANPQAVALAFTGWLCSTTASDDVLMCSMCRRHVGLWNFVSSSSQDSQLSPEKESEEDAEEGLSKSKKIKLSPDLKESFNPVEEHHHWCPWVKEVPMPAANSSSTGTTGSLTKTPQPPFSKTAPAFIVALRSIAPGLMDNNMGLACTMKTSPVVEGLRYFRRIIKAWSSPKLRLVMDTPSSSL